MEIWRKRVIRLKRETYALYLAYKDPRVPWYGRLWLVVVVGYALSPIDLIPDFIPVLGYLDDLIIVPLGILVAIRLVPPEVMDEYRLKAQTALERDGGLGRKAAVVVVGIWAAVGVGLVLMLLPVMGWK